MRRDSDVLSTPQSLCDRSPVPGEQQMTQSHGSRYGSNTHYLSCSPETGELPAGVRGGNDTVELPHSFRLGMIKKSCNDDGFIKTAN